MTEKPYVAQNQDGLWTVGNRHIRFVLGVNAQGIPVISALENNLTPDAGWIPDAGEGRIMPVVEVAGNRDLTFLDFEVDEAQGALCLRYAGENDLKVAHYLYPSADEAVIRSWVVLTNDGDQDMGSITRCDALNLTLGVSGYHPRVSYLLGWLDGPRVDAPGRPPAPFHHHGWLDKLVHGDQPRLLQPLPPAGWSTPTLRLITERLTRLPLKSGKRATWDAFPWATVLDPGREAGFFLGLEWSGTWKIELEHDQDAHTVALYAGADTYTHTLKPGETLTSPQAFIGFFAGDWDEAFNAGRRYVRKEIVPPPPKDFPFVHYVMFPSALSGTELYYPAYGGDVRKRLYSLVDAAADMGADSFLLDTVWWNQPPDGGSDFSIGLGDFTEDRTRFPDGLKALSDYIHGKGMVFGLWFEFERVDIRTANRGRNPWKPEWLVHQDGHPYRSWGQHFFMLCLGVKEAAEWALENLSWAVREYGVDWFMIDSNEWAVCQDPTHDHGEGDGEWAQVQGLYYVLRGLREQFPHLLIDNGAGGAQRGDFGMGRLCDVMPCSDINIPSVLNRQYSYGYGALYPVYYARQAVYYYPVKETGPVSRTDPTAFEEPFNVLLCEPDLTPERMEWRMINRMMGIFQPIYDLSQMPPEHLRILKKATITYKKLRPTLHGDRYVLNGPPVLVERENRESGQWEVYEHISLDRDLVSVFFFRCLSLEAEHRAVLRGLDPTATYRAEFHSGREDAVYSGAALMDRGIVCRLPEPRRAEVAILRRGR